LRSFQLIYLNFTALNKDKEAYQAYVDKQTAFLGNLLNTPQYWYMNEKAKVTEKNNPRFSSAIPTKEEFLEEGHLVTKLKEKVILPLSS